MHQPAYQFMPDYMRIPLSPMPQTAQHWVLYAYVLLSGAMLLWAAVRSRREHSPKPLFYVIGGGLTCFLEPVLARMADATHAQIGQITAFESLGLLIPVHTAISYIFYFGLGYILFVPAFRDRIHAPAKMVMVLASIAMSAWLFEIPFILAGLWRYYGDQPYQLFASAGLQPLWWSAGSVALLVVPITLLARLDDRLTGWRQWLIIPIAPMGAMAGAASTCWPVWVTLNSPASDALKFVAATITIGLTILLLWLVMPLICAPTDEPA